MTVIHQLIGIVDFTVRNDGSLDAFVVLGEVEKPAQTSRALISFLVGINLTVVNFLMFLALTVFNVKSINALLTNIGKLIVFKTILNHSRST